MADYVDTWNPNKLKDTLSSEQYQKWQQANTAYRSAFGSGNFSDFDYGAFLSDPQYAQNVYSTINDPARPELRAQRQMALNELLGFYKEMTGESAFGKIDVSPFFDPLRAQIDAQAAQSLQAQKGEISRAYGGAQTSATEALAGTGLGRSGVAAKTFSDIGREKAGAIERATERVEGARTAAQLQLQYQISSEEYKQALLEQGWNLQQAQDALQFDRALMQMDYQFSLQQAGIAAEEQRAGFMDVLGGVIGIGSDLASIYASYQTGGLYGTQAEYYKGLI